MEKYYIEASAGASMGKVQEVIQASSLEDALYEAHLIAWDEYESYGGLHGLSSVENIMEEDHDLSEDEAFEVHCNQVEDEIDYIAVPYDPELHGDFL